MKSPQPFNDGDGGGGGGGHRGRGGGVEGATFYKDPQP